MKKILYAAMLLLGVGIMAVSCSKDKNSENNNLLIGTWDAVSGYTVGPDGNKTDEWTYSAGETYYVFDAKNMSYYSEGELMQKGAYSFDGTRLTLPTSIVCEVTSLTESELIIRVKSFFEEGSYDYTILNKR